MGMLRIFCVLCSVLSEMGFCKGSCGKSRRSYELSAVHVLHLTPSLANLPRPTDCCRIICFKRPLSSKYASHRLLHSYTIAAVTEVDSNAVCAQPRGKYAHHASRIMMLQLEVLRSFPKESSRSTSILLINMALHSHEITPVRQY